MIRFRSRGSNRSGTARFLVPWVLAGLLGLWLPEACGQPPGRSPSKFYPDSSDPAEKILRNAAGHARDQQWSQAVELYQRVIDQFGGKVARVPKEEAGLDASGEFSLYMDARRFCHRALAQLPPEARAIYRNRVDSVAERWFRQGASNRDEGSLRRVIDQAFCSSWGDDAVELLGDLAFQDGRFAEALALYGLLVAGRTDDAFALVHPDPTVDLAKVAAKKLLCRAALLEQVPTPADLAEYARRYPGASGKLAGRGGDYSRIVAEALSADHLAPPPQPDTRWPTFAGALSRTKIVAGPIDVGSTQWRVDLEKVQPGRFLPGFGARMIGASSLVQPQERLLAFHPIILGDQVIVTDGARVLAFNLNDRPIGAEGTSIRSVEPAWKHERDSGAIGPQAMRPLSGIPRYTLTAVGHRVYARMGGITSFSPRMDAFSSRGANSIIALDWNTQGKLLWEQKSTSIVLPNRPQDRNGNRSVTFEGTPVADARNVYVALTDRSTQIATYVACYDAETGAPRWIHYLGSGSADAQNFPGFGMQFQLGASPGDYNHRLLSLDGATLYYQTNLGAVVALEAETGTTLWVGTYPRQEVNNLAGGGSERDLNPAVIADGRVFVAPSDSNSIFAFDAANGRLCWRSDPIAEEIKLAHLLGVAKGKLVATGNQVLLFDVKTGRIAHAWPDSGRSLEGYGRGLLAGDLIYWPTKNEIQVLDQRTGLRAQPPIKLLETYHINGGGNLAAGDGYLVVAQTDGLVVFCQNSRLIERFRDAIARAPDDASNYFRLGKAAEALGQDKEALSAYRQAARKAQANETIDGVPLLATSRDHLFRLLVRLGTEARQARLWRESVDRLESAFEAARSDPDRLQAELLLADVLTEAGRVRDAVAICSRVLADERLRPLAVVTPDGHRTVRADLFITDRLQTIVRASGRSIYASWDEQAAAMFGRGKRERDAHTLDEVCRRYPVARIVPQALSELGSIYQASGRMVEATHAYKRLLTLASDDEVRATAVWHLARVYEYRKLYLSARDAYLDLLSRYPQAQFSGLPGGKTVLEVVSAQLARPPYSLLEGDRAQPHVPVPLFRRWHWQPAPEQKMQALCAEGAAPSLDASRLLLVEHEGLRLLDPQTGSSRWFSETGFPIVWAAYSADKIVVASRHEVVALDLSGGAVAWRYSGAAGKGPARPDPFAGPKGDEKNDRETAPRSRDELHGFQMVKGRLFLLRGQHDLIALDVDTGAVDWMFSSPPREINSNLTIGDDRIWMQVDRPSQLLVLRADDGQMLSRHAMGENEYLRRPPVPVDEDSLLLVPDLLTVKKLDTSHGQSAWVYRESDELPVNGPPRVFSDGERVLVLHDGRMLIRLDPANGSKRWSCPLGIEDLSERPACMALDERRFYFTSGRTLKAVSLDDGLTVWSCYLSGPEEATWSIALTGAHVLAYPSKSETTDAAEVDNMCVVVRQRATGALVQRFVFPTTISSVAFKADPRGVFVATARGLWALGQREGGAASIPASSRR